MKANITKLTLIILVAMITGLYIFTIKRTDAQTPTVNLFNNGDMANWPNKGYYTNPVHDSETAEDWQWGKGNTASTWDVYRSADAPEGYNQSMKIEVTGIETTPSSGSNPHLRYMFYGYEVAQMEGKTFNVSFWVKSNVAGTQSFVLHNPYSTNLRTIAKDYTIAVANTWERKTVSVGVENSTYRTGVSEALKLRFCFGGHATFQITPNTWQNGNDVCSINQTRLETAANNYISFAGLEMVEAE